MAKRSEKTSPTNKPIDLVVPIRGRDGYQLLKIPLVDIVELIYERAKEYWRDGLTPTHVFLGPKEYLIAKHILDSRPQIREVGMTLMVLNLPMGPLEVLLKSSSGIEFGFKGEDALKVAGILYRDEVQDAKG